MAKIFINKQSEEYKDIVYDAVIDFNIVGNEDFKETFPVKVYYHKENNTLGYYYTDSKGRIIGDFIKLN